MPLTLLAKSHYHHWLRARHYDLYQEMGLDLVLGRISPLTRGIKAPHPTHLSEVHSISIPFLSVVELKEQDDVLISRLHCQRPGRYCFRSSGSMFRVQPHMALKEYFFAKSLVGLINDPIPHWMLMTPESSTLGEQSSRLLITVALITSSMVLGQLSPQKS